MKMRTLALSVLLSMLPLCGLLKAQITGVTAGTDLTGGGTSGNVTLNLDTTKVARLATANTFTTNQTVKGNLSASGIVTGGSFQIEVIFGAMAHSRMRMRTSGLPAIPQAPVVSIPPLAIRRCSRIRGAGATRPTVLAQ